MLEGVHSLALAFRLAKVPPPRSLTIFRYTSMVTASAKIGGRKKK